ncbi:MAG: hypothetical protein HQK54_07000, partial [Oligoflexales bacterium]|nr:hypothetical protein [Oligoflexales bacterium]
SIGVKGKDPYFEILEVSAENAVSLMIGASSTLFLIKYVGGADARTHSIYTQNQFGEDILNVNEGVPFSGLCLYTTSLELSTRVKASFKVVIAGASISAGVSEAFQGDRFSDFFQITKDDKIDDLLNLCGELFSKKVGRAALEDTALYLKYYGRFEESQDNLRRIINAALYSGEIKRVPYLDHHWNVGKASINADQNRVRVNGRLTQNIKGMTDSYVNYECEYVNDIQTVRNFDYKIKNPDRRWKDKAPEIIDQICHDANLEFRGRTGSF